MTHQGKKTDQWETGQFCTCTPSDDIHFQSQQTSNNSLSKAQIGPTVILDPICTGSYVCIINFQFVYSTMYHITGDLSDDVLDTPK